MKKDLRDKIHAFIASEEGRVGVKGPLTLGVATGSVLLAQVIIGTPDAEAKSCAHDGHCDGDQRCHDHGSCFTP